MQPRTQHCAALRCLILAACLTLIAGPGLATGLTPRQMVFQNVNAWVIEAERSAVTLELLPAAALSSGDEGKGQGLTLNAALRHKSIRRHLNKTRLLVNAGFSEGQGVVPAGLLLHQGEIISLSDWRKVPAVANSPCALARRERLRLSGGICVGKNGDVKVQPIDELDPARCREAVQSGPLLTMSGQGEVCEEAPETAQRALAARTALCETADMLKVVLVESPVSLAWLSAFLSAPVPAGGLACSRAINLSGGAASGLFLGGPFHTIAGVKLPLQKGNGNFPLASFLMIAEK